jgi:hypothetical protein
MELEAEPRKIHFQAEPGNEESVATYTEKLNIKFIPKYVPLRGKTSVASFAPRKKINLLEIYQLSVISYQFSLFTV